MIGLASLVVWYFVDAYKASARIINLILILPLTGVVLLCCVIQFFRQLGQKNESRCVGTERVKDTLPVILMFAVYVMTLPWLGFDIGTFLFVGSTLWFHGERRWIWLFGYSAFITSLAVLFFTTMLPYPMPLILFSK